MIITQESSPLQPSEATPLPSFVSRRLTFKAKTGILQVTFVGGASRADLCNWKQRRDGRTRERRCLRCLEAFPPCRSTSNRTVRSLSQKQTCRGLDDEEPPRKNSHPVNVEKQTDERCENERWSGDRQGAVEGFSLGILL